LKFFPFHFKQAMAFNVASTVAAFKMKSRMSN
jgi:hypothetical protein